MPDLSPEARERARETIHVASVFDAHADHIAAAVTEIADEHVLIAVVDTSHDFTGMHYVSRTELVETVAALEGDGGWAMVFSSGADAKAIRRRTAEMATIARQRVDAIERITARRAQRQNG